MTGCRGSTKQQEELFKETCALKKAPSTVQQRGMCQGHFFRIEVGLIQRHMDICRAAGACAGHLRLSLPTAKTLHLGNNGSHPGLKEAW